MENNVPKGLRQWLVVHFWADIIFAVPLMIAPRFLLEMFGWQEVDVFNARIVAAALFGIGIESFLARKAGRETFIGMLNLKIIWSFAAILGIAWSLAEGAQGRPLMAWVLLLIFVAFNLLWIYWRRRIGQAA